MRNYLYIRSCIRGLSITILRSVIGLFILISPLYGFDEPSFKELYHECIEGNCVSGTGTMIYYSTQKYVGEFKDGKRHGQGTLYLPLDRTPRGTWRNDEIVQGTATLSDGTRYTGTWAFGYRQGKGELTYPDGRKYVGEFHGGSKHGQGTMIYPDGRVYTGEFREGKRTGYGTVTHPNGRKITGRFSDGKYIESAH
jgi:hypothetical protein